MDKIAPDFVERSLLVSCSFPQEFIMARMMQIQAASVARRKGYSYVVVSTTHKVPKLLAYKERLQQCRVARLIAALEAAILAGDPVDPSHWVEVDPIAFMHTGSLRQKQS